MRDGFVFYRSFYECFSNLSKKDKLILFDALCNYALNDIEPELVGVTEAIFKLLKPQVDANNRRYENGCKGGRPKNNQDETKPKPNNNQGITKAERKDKEQEQDKDKEKEKDKGKEQVQEQPQGLASSRGRSLDDKYNIWKMLGGDGIDAVYDAFPETGGLLLQEVYEDIKSKGKTVKSPLAYVMGYAKNKNWDDNANHFNGGRA